MPTPKSTTSSSPHLVGRLSEGPGRCSKPTISTARPVSSGSKQQRVSGRGMREIAAEDLVQASAASAPGSAVLAAFAALSRLHQLQPGGRLPAARGAPRRLAGRAQPRPRTAARRGLRRGRAAARRPRSWAARPGAGPGRRPPPAHRGAGPGARAPGSPGGCPAAGERARLPAGCGAQRGGATGGAP